MQPGKSEVIGSTSGESQAPVTPQDGQTPAAGDSGGERLFAGQFKSVEELEAAYAAKTQPATPGEGGIPKIDEGSGEGDEDGVSDALKAAGLNQDDFTKEFAEKGDLSEESVAKLEKAGFPRDMVGIYLEGLKAKQAAYSSAVYGPAGGEAQYRELVSWAKTNLPEDQKRAFNDAVTSGDTGKAALAVQGLVALRGGGKPQLLNGKTASADIGPTPYKSHAQVVEAMRDPRYRRDPAYRKEVADRLRVSQVFK